MLAEPVTGLASGRRRARAVAAGAPARVALLGCLSTSLTAFRGRLIGELVARGHEVIGCAADHDPAVVAALRAMGVRFVEVPLDRTGLDPWRDLKSILALRRTFAALRPDVLLAYTMKPMVYGAIAARLAGVPRVYTMVEGLGYAFADGDERRRRLLRLIQSQLYRVAFTLSSGTFVLNPDDRDFLRRQRLASAGHPLVLLDGIGVELAHYAPTPVPAGPSHFLFIGRLIKDKGVAAFAAAARAVKVLHPDARFTVLGGFDTAPGAIDPATVEEWRAEGLIEYAGTTDDVRPFIAAATVFVLPSTYREGVPRSTLEAMAMGRAIVTTDAPGCRETVRHGENGFLVAKHDLHGLVAALCRFAAEPELARTMGAASRRLAETRFDDRVVNRAMIEAMRL
jgi:glycosyltransferase involved in cell wall biosynthesis